MCIALKKMYGKDMFRYIRIILASCLLQHIVQSVVLLWSLVFVCVMFWKCLFLPFLLASYKFL